VETYLGTTISSLDIRGIAVDENGLVYFTDWGTERVYKFDPEGSGPTRILADHSTHIAEFEPPFDVVVKSGSVYVSCPNAQYMRSEIKQFDTNLDYIKSLGTPDDFSLPVEPGEFFGPKRFVAILSQGFYVIDEDNANDRLAAFDDMSATNWLIYGTNGSGTGQFKFFEEVF
jgi:hypothetical protein